MMLEWLASMRELGGEMSLLRAWHGRLLARERKRRARLGLRVSTHEAEHTTWTRHAFAGMPVCVRGRPLCGHGVTGAAAPALAWLQAHGLSLPLALPRFHQRVLLARSQPSFRGRSPQHGPHVGLAGRCPASCFRRHLCSLHAHPRRGSASTSLAPGLGVAGPAQASQLPLRIL